MNVRFCLSRLGTPLGKGPLSGSLAEMASGKLEDPLYRLYLQTQGAALPFWKTRQAAQKDFVLAFAKADDSAIREGYLRSILDAAMASSRDASLEAPAASALSRWTKSHYGERACAGSEVEKSVNAAFVHQGPEGIKVQGLPDGFKVHAQLVQLFKKRLQNSALFYNDDFRKFSAVGSALQNFTVFKLISRREALLQREEAAVSSLS